ncbi:bacitracin transport system ATP-binding protein [Paenibacillus harenae]|uniref:Bacitracin transport system ATP-binding protein n=1 Tax=Paenibacillus harenae TaxID=306543 RepID=A0ABT9U0U9_PAEHA|nr:bacitracin transport system ATP-binding protein [Paenibacillus harenae]
MNMNVKAGDVYGFLGQNGAGKTTTLRMMMGLVRPSAGEIELFGATLQGNNNKAMERIGSIIEYPGFYHNLNAADNLEIHRRLMGMGNKECIDDVLSTVGLLDAKKQPVKNYSLGMKQRLGIARALLHHPELLILDEPTNGLDPGGMKEMRQLFLELASKRGISFLISSHQLSEIELLANKIGIIHQGKLLEEIDRETLQKKTRHYLQLKVTDERKAAFILEQKLPVPIRPYYRLYLIARISGTYDQSAVFISDPPGKDSLCQTGNRAIADCLDFSYFMRYGNSDRLDRVIHATNRF